MKIKMANRIAPDGTPTVLRRHIGGYSVCLCPIKRAPSLYGLKQHRNQTNNNYTNIPCS